MLSGPTQSTLHIFEKKYILINLINLINFYLSAC